MSQFWITFLAGIGSGIVILVLGLFIRNLIRTRSTNRAVFKLNTKQLGPVVVVVAGCIMAVLGLVLAKEYPLSLMGVLFGVLVIIIGAFLMLR